MQPTYAVASPYAGFWRRFAAYLIDGAILGLALFLVFFALGFVLGLQSVASGSPVPSTDSMGGAIAIIYLVWFVVTFLYFTLFEASSLQGTVGKLALSIKVTDLDGNRIGFGRAAGRWFAKFLSGLIIAIGFLMAAFTERKQALHDMVAGTLVMKKQPTEPLQAYAAYPGYAAYPPPPPPPPTMPPPAPPTSPPAAEPPPSV